MNDTDKKKAINKASEIINKRIAGKDVSALINYEDYALNLDERRMGAVEPVSDLLLMHQALEAKKNAILTDKVKVTDVSEMILTGLESKGSLADIKVLQDKIFEGLALYRSTFLQVDLSREKYSELVALESANPMNDGSYTGSAKKVKPLMHSISGNDDEIVRLEKQKQDIESYNGFLSNFGVYYESPSHEINKSDTGVLHFKAPVLNSIKAELKTLSYTNDQNEAALLRAASIISTIESEYSNLKSNTEENNDLLESAHDFLFFSNEFSTINKLINLSSKMSVKDIFDTYKAISPINIADAKRLLSGKSDADINQFVQDLLSEVGTDIAQAHKNVTQKISVLDKAHDITYVELQQQLNLNSGDEMLVAPEPTSF